MAHCVDLECLSLDELKLLASRVECRIRVLTETSTANTAADPSKSRFPTGSSSGHHAAANVSNQDSVAKATLSERVQGVIQANDPCEGSGVGPTRWSQPFYGGHVIRAPVMSDGFPRVPPPQVPLPTFGGAPCTNISGGCSKPAGPTTGASTSSPQDRSIVPCLELCVICYSPCCLAERPHGLHACERHQLL